MVRTYQICVGDSWNLLEGFAGDGYNLPEGFVGDS